MIALQIIAIICAGLLTLAVHRAGIARSLRAVGSAAWALAAAWEKGVSEYRECFAACMERAR